MQRSIFSNTVYKNRTSLVGIRVSPLQRTRQWSKDQASCIFLKAATFSVRPRGTQSCSALIQSLRTSRREKRKKKKNNFCLSTVPQDFINGLVAFPNIQMAAPSCSSVQLFVLQMWEMSNLSKTSHAEIARRERKKKKKKKLGSIYIILGLKLKTARVRGETETERLQRYEVICTVCNAKFSFYQLSIYNPWQGISF